MRTLTAFTWEIDDVDIAVGELLEQLDIENNLEANSAGIITCYPEFLETGVVAALREKLPFDILGCTTLGNATQKEVGQLMLCLYVITGDDISFSAAMSEPIGADTQGAIKRMYDKALQGLGASPVMMFSFLPLVFNVAGDVIVSALDKCSGGLPNFGTTCVDHTNDYSLAKTIYNKEACKDTVSILLVAGDIAPTFFVESVSQSKVMKQSAIITASEGNLLQAVNGISAMEYMQSIGLAKNNQIEGINSIPFLIRYAENTKPIARAIFAFTPEGYAVCGGEMPVNATLLVGSLDHDEVIATARDVTSAVAETKKQGGLLAFSCVARNIALGLETTDELQVVMQDLHARMPYQMSYSGGEICPVQDENGNLTNRFHNDTIVACLF